VFLVAGFLVSECFQFGIKHSSQLTEFRTRVSRHMQFG
jgi:hypothetical protein